MKLKSIPEDFRLEEIAEPALGGGPFAVYRLTKTSLGTLEAIRAICRAWRVPPKAVAVGGLKDRHAVTRQFLSIENGPRQKLAQASFELEYLGQAGRPFSSKDILANRFEIVLRDLAASEVPRIEAALQQAAEDGVPNYFDDQRFGSVGLSGDFIGRAWCLGDFERSLWLALAESNTHDRPDVRDEKQTLRERWEDWPACRRAAVRPATRAALERLCVRPHDFRGAFVRIPQSERRLYLEAFQSCLWNRILGERIRTLFDPRDLFEVEIGRSRLPFYRVASSPSSREDLDRPLPLPAARERSGLGPLTELYEKVAGEFGLECRLLRVKYPRDSFLSRGSRRAVFRPQSVRSETQTDELRAERQKVILRFELPPGSYATILVKRITLD